MKVVLVHGRYFNSWEALGLGYIAAYAQKHEPGVWMQAFQGSFDEPETIIKASRHADLLALSCTTPTAEWSVNLARKAKKVNPKLWVVMGGYHPSALAEAALVDGIDQVVVGEGEKAFLDIVRGNREAVVHGRPMDFSELPWPNRRLIQNERNIAEAAKENRGQRMTSFQAHRGCPFGCHFCADGACKVLLDGQPRRIVRQREAGDLLDEMESVRREYGLTYAKFCDPTWNSRVGWVLNFCEQKIRREMTLPYFANLHASAVTEEMMALMAQSGCKDVAFGMESGSDRLLKSCGKGITTEMVWQAVEFAKKEGLRVRGYFMLGLPGETEDDLAETESFAASLKLDTYGFTILCPYPGTLYHRQSPERFASVDWTNAEEYTNDFWQTEAVSNKRLHYWQRRLTTRFAGKLTQRQPKGKRCGTLR